MSIEKNDHQRGKHAYGETVLLDPRERMERASGSPGRGYEQSEWYPNVHVVTEGPDCASNSDPFLC